MNNSCCDTVVYPSRKVRQKYKFQSSSMVCKDEQDLEESFSFQNGYHCQNMEIPITNHTIFHETFFSQQSRESPCDMTLGEYFKHKYATAVEREEMMEAYQAAAALIITQPPQEYEILSREREGHPDRFLEIRQKADGLQDEWTQEIRRSRQLLVLSSDEEEASASDNTNGDNVTTGGGGYVKMRTPMRGMNEEFEEPLLPPLILARKVREEIEKNSVKKIEEAVSTGDKKDFKDHKQVYESPSTNNKGLGMDVKEGGFLCWRKLLQLFNSFHF